MRLRLAGDSKRCCCIRPDNWRHKRLPCLKSLTSDGPGLELPIDHFRLLGVSPTSDLQSLLLTLQQRIDRPPEHGLTQDTLRARGELLRASADLLSDGSRRQTYESDLTALASSGQSVLPALDVSPGMEVAGLLLLLEAGQALECFELVCAALEPPQAPILGNSRDADLTILAGLACLGAAADLHRQRRYEGAAQILQKGLQLLQRMGQQPAIRQQLEDKLDGLRPYRVLDLLSRNLTAQAERAEGLALLEELVKRRGGLEGFGDPSMGPEEFQAFFKQIRAFLTVQEQIDIFSRWAPSSAAADFLASTALTASGFAQRKPERIAAARQRLEASSQEGLQPLIACQLLLLGQVERAQAIFKQAAPPELKRWAELQSPDPLAQLCAYCRDWLSRDVLPDYRDLEADPDLEAYFADRDVQAYVEQQDRPASPAATPPALTFTTRPHSWDKPLIDPQASFGGIGSPAAAGSQSFDEDEDEDDDGEGEEEPWLAGWRWPQLRRPSRLFLAVCVGVALVTLAAVMRLRPQSPGASRTPIAVEPAPPPLPAPAPAPSAPVPAPAAAPASAELPLRADSPSEAQVQALLEAWLDAKAAILAGKDSRMPVEGLARASLVGRLEAERASDQARGETQTISTSITGLTIEERDTNRIAATVILSYSDQRLNAKGDPEGEPTKLQLRNRYVFGREGGIWRVASFSKAP